MRTTTIELSEENLSVAHHDSEFQNAVLDTMANEQEKEGQSWERGRQGSEREEWRERKYIQVYCSSTKLKL